MRNQEAARYARWAATAAGFIALVVIAFYVVRAIRAARRHGTPARISASVQRQMQTFTYNGMEGDRTLFTIRASRATEFKAGSPALLEDVWISIHGRKGDRNDAIHTRECSYAQKTGGVQCRGEVTIDIRGANPKSGAAGRGAVRVTTSDITFDGQTGDAASTAPVEFSLPQGHGSGVGVSYQTRAAIVRVEHAVKFDMAPDARTGNLPVHLEAASMEVRRNDRKVLLAGPVTVRQGDRALSAGNVTLLLGENFHARQVFAEGNPSMRASRRGELFQAAATTIAADLSPDGWVQHLSLIGNVAGSRRSVKGSSRFSSDRVEFSLEPARNILRQMTATGNVRAESNQGGISQTLRTASLQLNFAPGAPGTGADEQHVESANALGSSTIVMKDPRETTELRGPKFDARFSKTGRLAELTGSAGVVVRHTSAKSIGQISSARLLHASFAPDGQWITVDETGDVAFREGDRKAFAQHARINRAKGQITLTGSPILQDSSSRTTATTVTLAQKSGDFEADGSVMTTYFAGDRAASSKSATEPAHISAEKLTGSNASGRVTFSGHARVWQGDSLLEADRITVSREEKAFRATGNVTTAFVQVSGPSLLPASELKKPAASKKSAPTLWKVYAPELAYTANPGKAHLAGGVRIVSGDVSITAGTLDLDLAGGKKEAGTAPLSPLGGQLTRALASGDVVVRQGALRATAERAVYTASDGKFVLSGGKPTITDGSGNTASGRSLTFFLPNDTILIDSEEGSRTLTKYRVEK